jgi:hypothetical protein
MSSFTETLRYVFYKSESDSSEARQNTSQTRTPGTLHYKADIRSVRKMDDVSSVGDLSSNPHVQLNVQLICRRESDIIIEPASESQRESSGNTDSKSASQEQRHTVQDIGSVSESSEEAMTGENENGRLLTDTTRPEDFLSLRNRLTVLIPVYWRPRMAPLVNMAGVLARMGVVDRVILLFNNEDWLAPVCAGDEHADSACSRECNSKSATKTSQTLGTHGQSSGSHSSGQNDDSDIYKTRQATTEENDTCHGTRRCDSVSNKIIFVQGGSLTHRFLPRECIRTDAVLSMDDDFRPEQRQLELLLAVWQRFPERIVGPMWHTTRHTETVKYGDEFVRVYGTGGWKGFYDLMLTGFAVFHRCV